MPAHRDDPKAKAMYDLYQQGFSLAHVAQSFGVSRQGVYKMFALRGWPLRARPEPLPYVDFGGHRYTLRNTGYYGRTEGSRSLLHRDIWEAAHGPIPAGHDIHHRDGDRRNNHLANLELIEKAEHAARYPARQNQFTKRSRT